MTRDEATKLIRRVAAQGDILFMRVKEIPSWLPEVPPQEGRHVVAHSETGHHHIIAADGVVRYEGPKDPFTCYLRVTAEYADVVHLRGFDTHEPIRLGSGLWVGRRQREYTPVGMRMVQD